MAEGGREFTTVVADEDLLYCSVCMEEYEDPRALPCLHTFCFLCLVQLNSSSSPCKQRILKCPLCSEEHPIHPDKGVNGFRKDFRIKNLIGQHRASGTEAIPRSTSLEDAITSPSVELNTCSLHPEELLIYHCENSSCQVDICEKCWTSAHDTHSVKLLSKKISDAKGHVQQQMKKSIDQINAHINILINGKENMVDQYMEVRSEIQKRFVDIQEELNDAFQETCQKLDEAKNIQEKNMTDELQNLCTLQDTFIQLRDGLENENLPHSKKAFEKYEGMDAKMQNLHAELSQWNLTYTKPQASDPSELRFVEALGLTFLEESLVAEQSETKPDKDTLVAEKTRDEKPAETKTEVYKLPAQKSKPSKVWALQRGVDVLSGVQKGLRLFQTVPKGLIKGMQKGFQGGTQKRSAKTATNVQKVPEEVVDMQKVPEVVDVQKVPKVVDVQKAPEVFDVQRAPEVFDAQKAPEVVDVQKVPEAVDMQKVLVLKWKGFVAKRLINIESMTVSTFGTLFVAGKNHIFMYDTVYSPMRHIVEGMQPPVEDYANSVAVATSAETAQNFFVTFNAKNKIAAFYNDPFCPASAPFMRIPMHKSANRIIASSGHFVCYPFNKGKRVYVAVCLVENLTVTCQEEMHIPFKSGRVRSLCMYISQGGKPVIICTNLYNPGNTEKSEIALMALTSDELLWQVTFDDLDPNAENFDLRGVVCDEDTVFVINSKASTVYHVSQSGSSTRVLSLPETPPMIKFNAPSHICIDNKRKSLFIAHHKGVVSKFIYT